MGQPPKFNPQDSSLNFIEPRVPRLQNMVVTVRWFRTVVAQHFQCRQQSRVLGDAGAGVSDGAEFFRDVKPVTADVAEVANAFSTVAREMALGAIFNNAQPVLL